MGKALKVMLGALLTLAIVVAAAWSALALWFRLPAPEWARMGLGGFVAVVAFLAIFGLFRAWRLRGLAAFAVILAVVMAWWSTLTPPSARNYAPEVARQSYGEIVGDRLVMHDMRDFEWRSKEDYTENWISREYDLSELDTTDVFLPYWGPQYMAHLIVSFGFSDGEHLAWSVEVRRTEGGGFSPLADMFKSNTLAILASTERDLVGLRTNVRGEDVQLYRLKVRDFAARNILTAFVQDATQLAAKPRWYNALFTNCTTVVTTIMDGVGAGQAWDWRVIANGYLPEFAYDNGSVNTDLTLDELRELGRVAPRAIAHGLGDGFSQAIRVGVPVP
ncbi:MAG: DUF4105 domain-containing protein [Pelagimonas sp.]|uniref:Lnb N-terminal periplasmic domain-containing protein n=1 Tax=Pelagimonas sp. TaxID=2073170 RepID=UPI003D6B4796